MGHSESFLIIDTSLSVDNLFKSEVDKSLSLTGIFKDFATSGYGDVTIGALQGLNEAGVRDYEFNKGVAESSLNKFNTQFAATELAFKNRDSLVRSMMRKDIVRHLRYGKAGLSTKLKSSLALQNRMIRDYKGDYLDAAICALQAAEVIKIRNFGLPKNLDPLEGWIALS